MSGSQTSSSAARGRTRSAEPRLQVEYPTQWTYKVIGIGRGAIEDAARLAAHQRRHSLKASRTSSGGRYVSMNLEVEVEDDAARRAVFETLQGHEGVKWVL